MNWLSRWFARRAPANRAHAEMLAAYHAAPAPDGQDDIGAQRFIVVDVETSGLNPLEDRLLAIGAVGVRGGLIPLDDSFEVILHQKVCSAHDNILVHGIDGTTQLSGREHPEALLRFLTFAGKAPLVAFHADFDRIVISRAMHAALDATLSNAWIDLAAAAPALFPEHARHAHSLDDWTRLFGIENLSRHNALADAFATAQLLQVVLAQGAHDGVRCVGDLIAVSSARHWLAR